jgi:hypothetical protein
MSGSPSFARLRNKGANRIVPETVEDRRFQAAFRAFVAQPQNPANTADSRTALGDLAGISTENRGVAALRNSGTSATAPMPFSDRANARRVLIFWARRCLG